MKKIKILLLIGLSFVTADLFANQGEIINIELAQDIMHATNNGKMDFNYRYFQMTIDMIKKYKDVWSYILITRYPKTRSEGHHGILIKSAILLKPDKNNEIIDTPFGKMQYKGDKYTVPCQDTGWIIINNN